MILELRCLPSWPRLAWSARFQPGQPGISVYHGARMEAGEDWLVEAVWAGEFERADFDRTDLIVGTGIRLREGKAVFAGSGSAMDRLWHCRHEGVFCVSNSLPALLAVTRLSLRCDYDGYARDVESINCGRGSVHRYVRSIPSDGPDLQVCYFADLVYDGTSLREVPKPDTTPALRSYADYHAFLTQTAEDMGRNASAAARRTPVVPVATVSSGYDAAAVAALSRHAGCKRTVTIRNPTSFRRGSDSGRDIAHHLGLRCDEYTHSPRNYRCEEAVWAATGQPRGLNYTVFDFPDPLTLLFTGNYGELAWDLAQTGYLEPASDLSGLCLCEFRLLKGIFHCVPAWWGIRHLSEIRAIGHSEEMRPWRLGTGYDRPIPRRILEDAGVPRTAFGMKKMNTSSHTEFWWPYARESQASLRRYMRELGRYAPGRVLAGVLRRAAKGENLIYKNVMRRLGLGRRFRPWGRIASDRYLFQWANHELKKRYAEGLARLDEHRDGVDRETALGSLGSGSRQER